MTIQPISSTSMALFLTPTDLHQRGIRSEELTNEHTLALIQEALCQAGLSPGGSLEIESYPDKCGLLIFVHITSEVQSTWRFEDSEALLAAAATLEDETVGGTLYWWEDHFWLILPRCSERIRALLSEFGTPETAAPYLSARLNEYGTVLLPANALSALCRYFKR